MRILLKLSWEALAWETNQMYDINILKNIVSELKELKKENIQIWIVIWWWNIFRWKDGESLWIDRVTRDYMWMLSTVMNWMALSDFFEENWVPSKLLTWTKIDCIWDRYDKKLAVEYLNKWFVTIFAWSMWTPYFTTDTWWVVRSLEIEADTMIKLTSVDWVYNKDPKTNFDAVMYDKISYDEVLSKNLKVMDSTAVALARDSRLVLKVVNLYKEWAILRACLCGDEGTTIN